LYIAIISFLALLDKSLNVLLHAGGDGMMGSPSGYMRLKREDLCISVNQMLHIASIAPWAG
jgi:hypothetical protein